MSARTLKTQLTAQLRKFTWVKFTDRLLIAAKLNKSRPTIDTYIKQCGIDLVFAEDLVKELKKIKKPRVRRIKKY